MKANIRTAEPVWSSATQAVRRLPVMDSSIRLLGAHWEQVGKGWSESEDVHGSFELILVLEGEQETIVDDQRHLLRCGDMVLIPYGRSHMSRCTSNYGMAYFSIRFNIDDPQFRQGLAAYPRIFLPALSPEARDLRKALDRLLDVANREDPLPAAGRFELQLYLFDLYAALIRMVARSSHTGSPAAPSAVRLAREIASAIREGFDPYEEESMEEAGGLQIRKIAAALGISPGYCQEVFRQVYDVSPRQFLSELKLKEAKMLLQQQKMSVQDISAKLGYPDTAHFCRQFKRWTGLTPTQFRKQ